MLLALALEEAHAQVITRAQHPTGRLSAQPARLSGRGGRAGGGKSGSLGGGEYGGFATWLVIWFPP
jgi:hypothetical protein